MGEQLFFADQEVADLAQDHIDKISNYSEKKAQEITKAYRRVRQDLRDRLDALDSRGKDDTFTAQKTRGALLQVESALATMTKNLNSDLNAASLDVAGMGIENLVREIEKWNEHFTGALIPINIDAVAVATDTSNFLFNQREASLEAYSAAIRSKMAYAITDAAIAEVTMSELNANIGKFFLGEEWVIQRLVRTELHNIYNRGKINGMFDIREKSIPDLQKTLFHPMDKRTGKDSKRLAANNPIVDLDKPFIENSTGKTLEYMAPPNRPNDRAILIPFRTAWV